MKITTNIARLIFGVCLMIVLMTMIYGLLKFEIPPNNETVINVLVGGFATMLTNVAGYYFGSSSGSAKKDDIIEHTIKHKLPTSTPPTNKIKEKADAK